MFQKTILKFSVLSIVAISTICHAELFTKGRGGFSIDDPIVSTSFFHWYTADAGQKVGPWRPLEGRENWTGSVQWWKGQIKQTMLANIDVLYVHLIMEMQDQRVNLFKAYSELRAQGYDVPQIAPFLDPMIIWLGQKADMSKPERKQELISQYARFFDQYFSVNTDKHAADYLAKIDGRLVLVTWHVHVNTTNLDSFSRDDLEKGLAKRFAGKYPAFNNGIYMITTRVSETTFSFVDEKAFLFELHGYHVQSEFKGIVTAMVKPGYWDQNVRTPGYCLPRAGGVNYRSAWEQVLTSSHVHRVYIESFNEYDEGSGIYAGDPGPCYIHPGQDNDSTDRWSVSNDPFEYLKTTAAGARAFNDRVDYDATPLLHDVPSKMAAKKAYTVNVVIRNQGDLLWNNKGDVKLCQQWMLSGDTVRTKFTAIDMTKDNLFYGGIYRGCPTTFKVSMVSPVKSGLYDLMIGMSRNGKYFGETLNIKVKIN